MTHDLDSAGDMHHTLEHAEEHLQLSKDLHHEDIQRCHFHLDMVELYADIAITQADVLLSKGLLPSGSNIVDTSEVQDLFDEIEQEEAKAGLRYEEGSDWGRTVHHARARARLASAKARVLFAEELTL